MEAILLAIYSFFVWLIFIKFKWLPWNTGTQVTVVIIPIVAMAALILTLNVVAPSSADVRVIKYVVQVIPQVRGRVLEVPVEPNRLVKKGELLFRIDPTQYENELNVAKARLAADEAKFAQAGAGLVDASAGARQLQEQLKSASGAGAHAATPAGAGAPRVRQNRELVATGAGDRFALEQAEANVAELEARSPPPPPTRRRSRSSCRHRVNGEQASVAGRAPSWPPPRPRSIPAAPTWPTRSGIWTRPRSMRRPAAMPSTCSCAPAPIVTAIPVAPAMSFVEEEYQVIALYAQNELRLVEPGNPAEFTLQDLPRRVIKAKVDSIVWAQGQGQVAVGHGAEDRGLSAGAGPLPGQAGGRRT
jgi:multidrug resistance efflux pump